MFGDFLGYFEVCHFLRKTNLITFWVSIGNFGLLLIPISGHTAGHNPFLPLNAVVSVMF